MTANGVLLDIAIPGTGCPKCRQPAGIVRQALEQSWVGATIRKAEDVREIMRCRGLMTPAAITGGDVNIFGRVPGVSEARKRLPETP